MACREEGELFTRSKLRCGSQSPFTFLSKTIED